MSRRLPVAPDAPGEQWLPVVGWEDAYLVSNLGRVVSHARGPARELRPFGRRYLEVKLHSDGRNRSRKVHLLVLEAFVGPTPEGLEARHLDGDSKNNSLTNLRYGTHAENSLDQIAHGTHPQASKRACKNGHPYDERNTHISREASTGGVRRNCRACSAENTRRLRSRRAAA